MGALCCHTTVVPRTTQELEVVPKSHGEQDEKEESEDASVSHIPLIPSPPSPLPPVIPRSKKRLINREHSQQPFLQTLAIDTAVCPLPRVEYIEVPRFVTENALLKTN
jgi:hypothetical protein